MVFRTILKHEYMHNYNVALDRHRIYIHLLLMDNARTRTTACFPIIAVNGSIHVCMTTTKKEKALQNDKMGYFIYNILFFFIYL